MPVWYNPFGGLTPQDFWNGLEAYYPVYIFIPLAVGGNILMNIAGVRGAITAIGTTSPTVNLNVTLDGVPRIINTNMPVNEAIRIEGAFQNACLIQINNGAGLGFFAWVTYRRL